MSSKTLGAWTIENMGHNSKMSFTVNKWWQLATTSCTSCSENPWQGMSSNTELHLIGLPFTSIKESVKSNLSWLEKGLVEENPLVAPLSLCLKCSNKGLLKFHTNHSYILKKSNTTGVSRLLRLDALIDWFICRHTDTHLLWPLLWYPPHNDFSCCPC